MFSAVPIIFLRGRCAGSLRSKHHRHQHHQMAEREILMLEPEINRLHTTKTA
jgi:hypothetical protein